MNIPEGPPSIATVKTTIGGQHYSLRVAAASETEVQTAISQVADRFYAIEASGKITNPERIAVMVALNLAIELYKTQQTLSQVLSNSVPYADFPMDDITQLRQDIGQLVD